MEEDWDDAASESTLPSQDGSRTSSPALSERTDVQEPQTLEEEDTKYFHFNNTNFPSQAETLASKLLRNNPGYIARRYNQASKVNYVVDLEDRQRNELSGAFVPRPPPPKEVEDVIDIPRPVEHPDSDDDAMDVTSLLQNLRNEAFDKCLQELSSMKRRIEERALFSIDLPIHKETQTQLRWDQLVDNDTRELITSLREELSERRGTYERRMLLMQQKCEEEVERAREQSVSQVEVIRKEYEKQIANILATQDVRTKNLLQEQEFVFVSRLQQYQFEFHNKLQHCLNEEAPKYLSELSGLKTALDSAKDSVVHKKDILKKLSQEDIYIDDINEFITNARKTNDHIEKSREALVQSIQSVMVDHQKFGHPRHFDSKSTQINESDLLKEFRMLNKELISTEVQASPEVSDFTQQTKMGNLPLKYLNQDVSSTGTPVDGEEPQRSPRRRKKRGVRSDRKRKPIRQQLQINTSTRRNSNAKMLSPRKSTFSENTPNSPRWKEPSSSPRKRFDHGAREAEARWSLIQETLSPSRRNSESNRPTSVHEAKKHIKTLIDGEENGEVTPRKQSIPKHAIDEQLEEEEEGEKNAYVEEIKEEQEEQEEEEVEKQEIVPTKPKVSINTNIETPGSNFTSVNTPRTETYEGGSDHEDVSSDSDEVLFGDDEQEVNSPREKKRKRLQDIDKRYSYQKPESPHFDERRKLVIGQEEEKNDMSIRIVFNPDEKRRRRTPKVKAHTRSKSVQEKPKNLLLYGDDENANLIEDLDDAQVDKNVLAEKTARRHSSVQRLEEGKLKLKQAIVTDLQVGLPHRSEPATAYHPEFGEEEKKIAFEIDYDRMADYMTRIKEVYTRKEAVMLQAIDNMRLHVEDLKKYYTEMDSKSVSVRAKQAQAIMKLSYDNLMLTKKIERLSLHQRDLVRGRWKVDIESNTMKFVPHDGEEDQLLAAHTKDTISPAKTQQATGQPQPIVSKKQQLVHNILFDDFSTNYALKTSLSGKVQDTNWKNFHDYKEKETKLVTKRLRGQSNVSINGSLSARKPTNDEPLKLPLIGNQMQLL